ncbi:MAG: phosphoribulokinase, partial [Burkholderiales bacterium]
MSRQHPVIAVTGSSGAGTSSVTRTFQHIFRREKIKAVTVEGDSFHRYNREEMKREIAKAEKNGNHPVSHFGPEANLFEKLETLFRQYGETGTGKLRRYLHNEEEAAPYNQKSGTFTAWEPIAADSEVLFYEGLHGGVVTPDANVAKHADLLIGVVPIVNLEWIQKIHRDMQDRGYSIEA